MNDFSTKIEVSAPPRAVWNFLTRAEKWGDWHPTIKAIEGNFQLGEKLKISTGDAPNQQFNTKITEFTPNQSMTLESGSYLGLLKTAQTFILSEPRRDVTELQIHQEYKGFLIVFVAKAIPDMTPALAEVAQAIKKQFSA